MNRIVQPLCFRTRAKHSFGPPKPDKHLALHRTGLFGAAKICLRQYKLRHIMQFAKKERLGRICRRVSRQSNITLRHIQSATFGSIWIPPFHSEQRRPSSTIGTSHEAITSAQPEQIQDTDLHSRYQLTVSETTKNYYGPNKAPTTHQATCCCQISSYKNADIH